MNIFHTHADPYECAKSLCDKHVPKMLLETMQMICTAHHHAGFAPPPLYRAAYDNHPMTKWVRETKGNYIWTLSHAFAIADEYELRYHKVHASSCLFPFLPPPDGLPDGDVTMPPQCMPEEYKSDDHIIAYRAYYMGEKRRFAAWQKGRKQPAWFV